MCRRDEIRLPTTVAGALCCSARTAACVAAARRRCNGRRRGQARESRGSTPGAGTTKEMILPSGLRLLLEEDPDATLAGVVSVVRGGSGADPAGGEGLAHMVEHLTYRAVDGAPARHRR